MKKLQLAISILGLCFISNSLASQVVDASMKAQKDEIVERCVKEIEAKPSEEFKAWKFDAKKYCECMFNVGYEHIEMKKGMLGCFKQFDIPKEHLDEIEKMIDNQESE